ncbi:hypothetical protein HMPREF3191_00993 [Veillonellaceae bacterium DNF00626]|jgi:hypothetical protein|nr:hypothetical protein HMPREF3191_00993 [Veillonellaceae bacterium DNF00626]
MIEIYFHEVVMDIIAYLIVCPLSFLAGFIDAIAGGGGLISLPAYIIAGVPIHNSIATNKLSAAMGTLLTTAKFAKSGLIPWRTALPGVVFAILGSSLGAHLALLLDAEIFLFFMLIILPLTALYVTQKKSMEEKKSYPFTKTALISCFIAFILGIYDGFYGPGTGTFLILLLVGLAHVKLSQSNGITKVINSTTNVAALAVFFMNDTVWITLGLISGFFNMAGNYLGATYFEKSGPKNVRPVIMFVLTIFFIKVLYELFMK